MGRLVIAEAVNPHRFRLLNENPALRREGWLPPDAVLPDLDGKRAEHQRLLEVVRELNDALVELGARHRAEDEAAVAATREAILAGNDPVLVPTPDKELQAAESAEAQMRHAAATEALQQFAQETIETVRAQAPEWEDELAEREAAADSKREQARRLLAEAETLVLELGRVRQWIDRTTGKLIFGHLPWDEIKVPTGATHTGPADPYPGLREAEVI